MPQNSGNGKQKLKRAHHASGCLYLRIPFSFSVRLFPEISFLNPAKKLATGRHLSPNKPRMLNLPNAITLTRIALVVVFTAAVSVADQYSWGYLAALVTFILAACTDWLDGYLARRLNQVTTFGKLIDPLADKIAVSAAFIYLTGEGLCPAWITILIISREFLVTGLRQIAQDHGVIIPAGTSGKWKTAFQLAFCIACLLALTWTHTPEYLPSIADRLAALCLWHGSGASNLLYQVTLWGSVILTVYSGAVYCAGARKFLQR